MQKRPAKNNLEKAYLGGSHGGEVLPVIGNGKYASPRSKLKMTKGSHRSKFN